MIVMVMKIGRDKGLLFLPGKTSIFSFNIPYLA